MAITMVERFTSRSRRINRQGEAELRFLVNGSDDDQAVTDHVLANAPATWADMPSQETSIEPLGGGAWDVIIRYAPNSQQNQALPVPPPVVGDSEFSFDTTGGTQHIKQSLATVGGWAATGMPAIPNFSRAINVTGNGVDGVDIVVPQFTYEETHQVAAATVTAGLPATIYNLTATVNNATFKGFAAGEVLFIGAAGRKRQTEDFWTITFRFICSKNLTGLSVGDITGIAKNGWEYLWAYYESVPDDDAKMLVVSPVAAYAERVYEDGNFSLLGIGT